MRVAATLLTLVSSLSVTAALDPCSTYADATALLDAFETARESTGTKTIAVCASSTPIAWSMTSITRNATTNVVTSYAPKLDTNNQIWLNTNANQVFKLLCVIPETADYDRCIVDFAPAQGVVFDSLSQYGGFILKNKNQLVVDGFEFMNRATKGPIFYNQEGSVLTIKNSVFKE